MIWTRSETIALAKQHCSICFGLGLRPGRNGKEEACNCVLRSIFRACYVRFRNCSMRDHMSRISLLSLESGGTGRRGSRARTWAMRNQDFCADFVLTARRTLGVDSRAYQIFKAHFLLGADWKLCTRELKIDRGTFFHDVYRVEQRLGRAFREIEPYALFPLDEYFSGAEGVNRSAARPLAVEAAKPERGLCASLRFPLLAAA